MQGLIGTTVSSFPPTLTSELYIIGAPLVACWQDGRHVRIHCLTGKTCADGCYTSSRIELPQNCAIILSLYIRFIHLFKYFQV
jgi:hypothetical protein